MKERNCSNQCIEMLFNHLDLAKSWSTSYIKQNSEYYLNLRPAKKASPYYGLERVCQCKATCSWWFCHLYLVDSYLLFFSVVSSLRKMVKNFGYWWFLIRLFRNDNNQLLLGIRRANRPQTVMPSSVLSSDSMHIGLLAAAAHAAATNSRFTIFYNPRWIFTFI